MYSIRSSLCTYSYPIFPFLSAIYFSALAPWYLHKMETQNMLRAHEVKQVLYKYQVCDCSRSNHYLRNRSNNRNYSNSAHLFLSNHLIQVPCLAPAISIFSVQARISIFALRGCQKIAR